MPTKYPGITFLYKRRARELHIGKSPEGIYYSSEAEPLRYIECSQVTSVPDNFLLLIKNGIIYDATRLAEPQIKSIPLGASRNTWDTTATDDELANFPELVKKSKYTSSPYGRQNRIWEGYEEGAYYTMSNRPTAPKKEKKAPPIDATESAEILYGVIKDVMELAARTAPEVITHEKYEEATTYEAADAESCIVVIKMINAKDKKDLAGWVAYDKNDDRICSATAPNGVLALKYPNAMCFKNTDIIIADPIDGTTCFEYTFEPKRSRIVEVVLSIPFRTEAQPSSGPQNADISQRVTAALLSKDTLSRDLPSFRPSEHFGNSCASAVHRKLLPESKDDISRPSTQDAALGNEEREGVNAEPVGNTITGIDSNAREVSELLGSPLSLTYLDLRTIFAKEDRLFIQKDKILSLLSSPEVSYMKRAMVNVFDDYINIKQLASDALAIKLHREAMGARHFSVMAYAVQILRLMPTRVKKQDAVITYERRQQLNQFCDNYIGGRLPSMAPMEVGEEEKK
jgi:hypothetical protein